VVSSRRQTLAKERSLCVVCTNRSVMDYSTCITITHGLNIIVRQYNDTSINDGLAFAGIIACTSGSLASQMRT
jgi:hypothetical protein